MAAGPGSTVPTPSPATVSLADLRQVVALAVDRHPDQRARIEHAAMIVTLRRIRLDSQYADTVLVESESEAGRFYAVDPNLGVCACLDVQRRGAVCKHLWSLRLVRALLRLHTPSAVAA